MLAKDTPDEEALLCFSSDFYIWPNCRFSADFVAYTTIYFETIFTLFVFKFTKHKVETFHAYKFYFSIKEQKFKQKVDLLSSMLSGGSEQN